jgi:protein-tyrosine-phosphatase
MNNKLRSFIKQISLDCSVISLERKEELDEIARTIIHHLKDERNLDIIVVCTHNSRRSQLGEIWINTLAPYFGLETIIAYSGGMEETAFNIRMVRALRYFGFEIKEMEEGKNPKYALNSENIKNHPLFSKVFDHEMNPKSGFMALMVCGHADENCPIVQGMKYRIPLRYEDPKVFDGTAQENGAYRNKVKEIGREMYYLLDKIRPLS